MGKNENLGENREWDLVKAETILIKDKYVKRI